MFNWSQPKLSNANTALARKITTQVGWKHPKRQKNSPKTVNATNKGLKMHNTGSFYNYCLVSYK